MLWRWLPRFVYLALRKRWTLDTYELKKTASGVVEVSDRSSALSAPKEMEFSGWQLAHAVRLAESNLLPPRSVLNLSMLGFLAEFGYLLGHSSTEFRLADGAIGSLDDFVQSSFAGRLGQGVGLLWMRQRGYSFNTRFQQLCLEVEPPISLYNASGKKLPSPDMAFTASVGDALLETKAKFIRPSNLKPSLVQPLNKGLEQLEGWGAKFNPAFGRSFATALLMRELSDPHAEGSMLLWTDPENSPGDHAVPPGLVPTTHYAAWLHAMGADAAAARLLGRRRVVEQRFQVAPIGGEWFAVQRLGQVPNLGWLVAGIRLETLRRIAELSARRSTPDAATGFPILDSFSAGEPLSQTSLERGSEQGSEFSDGTYFGLSGNPQEVVGLEF